MYTAYCTNVRLTHNRERKGKRRRKEEREVEIMFGEEERKKGNVHETPLSSCMCKGRKIYTCREEIRREGGSRERVRGKGERPPTFAAHPHLRGC